MRRLSRIKLPFFGRDTEADHEEDGCLPNESVEPVLLPPQDSRCAVE
jgi:hypothetical protein